MEAHPDLIKFLAPYDQSIQELVIQLRTFVIDCLPTTNELIWDNYNAVAIAYSKSDRLKDAFCHLAVYRAHVNFGFNRGVELSNQAIPLEGKGTLIRHYKVKQFKDFPKKEIQKMLYEAIGISEQRNAGLLEPVLTAQSLVMSVSEKKIRPSKQK